MYNSTLSLTTALDGWWVVNSVLLRLYLQGKRPGTHCTKDMVCPKIGLDRYEKSRFPPLFGIQSPDRPVCGKSVTFLNPYQTTGDIIYIYIYFFFCGTATQSGSWPPHS